MTMGFVAWRPFLIYNEPGAFHAGRLPLRKKVKEADPTLEDRLEEELPNILQKCVRAYLEKAQAHKNDAIWNILPPYFEKVKTQET